MTREYESGPEFGPDPMIFDSYPLELGKILNMAFNFGSMHAM
jgi:hypothetical protein